MSATYTKLRNGLWGIRGTGTAPSSGSSVPVMTKAGKSKVETVRSVLWSGSDRTSGQPAWIASTAPRARRSSEGEGWRNNGCSACRRRGDWCDRCAFDEFDN